MTQLEKNNLVTVLNKSALRDACYFTYKVNNLGEHIREESPLKYDIDLIPNHNWIKNLDRIVYGVKSVSSTLSIYLDTVNESKIVIL